MKIVAWVVTVSLVLSLGLLAFMLLTDGGPKVIRDSARAVKEMAFPSATPSSAEKKPVEPDTKPLQSAVRPKPSRDGGEKPLPAPPVDPRTTTVTGAVQPFPTRPKPPLRADYYVTGNASGWRSYEIPVDVPMRLRAGGVVTVADDRSGPDGLEGSSYERAVSRRRAEPGRDERVMPAAPYLALIGRVCSGDVCADPFVVGSVKLLCPSASDVNGRLQLWTNNYVHVDGAQTLNRYSTALGGYAIYAESAPASACDPRAPTIPMVSDAMVLAQGRVLKKPEFVISSSQTAWKPFFLPLDQPIHLHASGEMQPRGGARATGPEGIVVPPDGRWQYPGTFDVFVDADSRLYDPAFPYQALIGRVCGPNSCDRPFLVGTDRNVCATEPFTRRLELWINHIILPRGLLGTAMPVTLQAFDLQGRHGEYRFEVSRAPAGGCGN